jgi:small conductance mechanosensitive channel
MLPLLFAQVAPVLNQATGAAETLAPLTKDARWKALKAQILNGDWELSQADWLLLLQITVFKALLVLILVFLTWTISAWMSGIVARGLTRIKFDETLTKFIAKLVRWAILLLAGLACLSTFGVETTSFAAVIGAAGLAIGLAFQGTLSNFAAGAMLLVFRPYKVGDVVNVAGNVGKVYEIGLFSTAIDTFDKRRFIIPNSQISGAVIENITYHAARRVEVEVGTSYSADIDQTRQVLEQAIASVSLFVPYPEPAVVLTGLGASSVDWSVRAFAKNADFGDAKQALIRAVKIELDRAEIEIPYPHMNVLVDQSA